MRYASPAFWSRADFDRFAAQRRVLQESACLIPSRVGIHKKWMYAGPSGKVILNPDPEDLDSEAWETVSALMAEVSREESILAHITALASICGSFSIPPSRRIRRG